ncbi:MAG TPA: glycosyltransferase family 2 protein [Nitrospiria bacterium]|nr:glycosyltransferase family 2 protein [Nitrospiria bacterium]
MKLVVVIPAYNEEFAIGQVIQHVMSANLPGFEKAIIVVNDGSSDKTGDIARSKGALVVRHLLNRGVGGALGTGIEAALRLGADVVVTCDADGQHSPDDIGRIVEPIQTGRAEAVTGSRMIDSSAMPWSRRVANHLANLTTWILLAASTTDSQSGLRAFSRSAASRIRITTNRYEVCSEICGEVQRLRLRSVDVPIKTIYTDYSLSKGQGFRVGIKTLFRLILSKLVRQS